MISATLVFSPYPCLCMGWERGKHSPASSTGCCIGLACSIFPSASMFLGFRPFHIAGPMFYVISPFQEGWAFICSVVIHLVSAASRFKFWCNDILNQTYQCQCLLPIIVMTVPLLNNKKWVLWILVVLCFFLSSLFRCFFFFFIKVSHIF